MSRKSNRDARAEISRRFPNLQAGGGTDEVDDNTIYLIEQHDYHESEETPSPYIKQIIGFVRTSKECTQVLDELRSDKFSRLYTIEHKPYTFELDGKTHVGPTSQSHYPQFTAKACYHIAPGDYSDIGLRFKLLTKRWLDETAIHSSARIHLEHPAFLEIVSLGKDVLPLIFLHMTFEESLFWCNAAEKILGEGPEFEKHCTSREYVEGWVNWGKEHGYLPR